MKSSAKHRYISYVMPYFFLYFSMGAYNGILSLYLKEIGKSSSEISFIISAANIFSLISIPITGYLTDIVKKPKYIPTVALSISAVLSIAFAFTQSVWILFFLNGFVMTGISCVSPISERLAASCEYRYGSIRIWGTVGYAISMQINTILLENFSPIWLFILLFFSGAFGAVGFWIVGGDEPIAKEKPVEQQNKGTVIRSILTPAFVLFIVIAFIFNGASGVNMTYIPMLLQDMGLPVSQVGTVLLVSTLVEIPLIFFSHKFMDYFSVKAIMSASFILILVQFIVYSQASSAVPIVVVMILFKAIASTLYQMVALKAVRNIVNPLYITTGLSVLNSVSSLGGIVMQNVSGFVADMSGIQFLYLVLAVIMGIGLMITLFLKVENRERVFGN